MDEQPILQMRGIAKSFPGVQALAGVDFYVRRGEIHALVGENGAGKSTLMKILAGAGTRDAGEIIFDGHPISPDNPAEAQSLGISLVHQELSLAPNLTVAENIFVRREPRRFGLIDWKRLNTRARELLEEFELHIPTDTPVKNLSLGTRQIIEIAKAFQVEAKLLILDEPTSSLETHEVELLFRLLRRLASRGIGVVYITHKMDEIFSLTDRISVLRDGRIAGMRDRHETSAHEIIGLMVGRALDSLFPPKAGKIGEVVFEVRGLTSRGKFKEVSLLVHRGEILGLAGLIGSGRSEAMMASTGCVQLDAGEIFLDGKCVRIDRPTDALRHRVVYSPEDRRNQGLFQGKGVRENVIAASLSECSRADIQQRSAARRLDSGL